MQFRDGTIQWNVIFTRLVQDWEVEMVLSFFERLYSIQLRHGDEDRISWSPSNRSKFEVKSFYEVLTSQDGPSFLWKSIWSVKSPSRVTFFVWIATLEKILTLDNLRKMNVVVVE
jgi:hypothetical protein